MSKISLYRKYRPATFEEVVGQEHVTRTLENAIAAGKVSHAYLFAGSRGTGKTSTAKLLAKALNCTQGPTAHPCGKCESCVAIGAGTSLDVIEMDAASNRGIDDIRDIRDKVAYSPVEGRSKVYILDEAHMLTKEASNAFLKVLEEPPAHVIFVLCTTEAHKVIPTIQSRCQKFEFRRPDAGMVLEVLARIAAAEGLDAEEAALAAIARSSAGAYRDAIGALDQLATYCNETISLADVLAMLGTVESELLFEAVDIIAAEDVRGAILFINHLSERGRDLGQFAAELIGHLRNIFLLQQLDDYPDGVISAPAEDIVRLRGQARALAPAQVMRFIELLIKAQAETKLGSDARLQLELAFITAARPEVDMSTKSLLYRLEQLEQLEQRRTARAAASAPETAPAGPPAPGAVAGDDAPDPAAGKLAAVPDGAGAGEAAPAYSAPPPELTLDKITRAWGVIMAQVKKKKIPLYSLLQEARPVELKGAVLTLGFPAEADFNKEQVEKPAYAAIVAEALREITGADLRLRCIITGSGPRPLAQPAAPSAEEVIAMIKEELGAEEI
ncbi:MAG: DNA polymerase III subunit gamma/tau [Thermoleophilia bacterium]